MFWLVTLRVSATHLLGGYIQVKKTASATLEYEYNVFLFLNAVDGSGAAQQQETVLLCFGDGTTGQATRVRQQPLEQNRAIALHTYRVTHTYAGSGTYTVSSTVSNRTVVQNAGNVSNVSFFISTTFTAGVPNSTPIIDIPANGFVAAANQRTTFTLRGVDADGDSLVYKLASPLTSAASQASNACGQTVLLLAPFQFPNDVAQRGIFRLNNRTGDLVWDAPVQVGRFTFGMSIDEWRNGLKIGTTLYEMAITVEDRNVQPGTLPTYEPAFSGPVITGLASGYMNEDIQISVYPNPTHDRVQVRVSSREALAVTLQLMNSKGGIVGECHIANPQAEQLSEFGMAALPTGLYLLRTEVSGRSYTQKIVKR
ncbi:hypothetical protein GCM10023187_29290 [Nibrella viscosa]|uniref:PKD domain-containing protein n=1 Tax=Nibrella viscosa TaxID=1084524 RepID=A0ABP8KIH9_9BACT